MLCGSCLMADRVVAQSTPNLANPGLEQAARNYPPLILGATARPADGTPPYARSCAVGGRVEQRGGPTVEYLGATPGNPDLCRLRIGGEVTEAWFGIWATAWPGADAAYPALRRIIQGRTGDVQGFDVRMQPGMQWHDLIRNEGTEDIRLLDTTYHALRLSHYREGFDGNSYRSVITVWVDIPTGMQIFATYQHISGAPEIDAPLLPTRIVPGP